MIDKLLIKFLSILAVRHKPGQDTVQLSNTPELHTMQQRQRQQSCFANVFPIRKVNPASAPIFCKVDIGRIPACWNVFLHCILFLFCTLIFFFPERFLLF